LDRLLGQQVTRQPVDEPRRHGRRFRRKVHVTLFRVITRQAGADPIFMGAADFDLELIESRTLDGRTQELIYLPSYNN
jgi:hypothetical protein